jgi:thiol-disulfide isomerase/thioredoxin
VDVTLTRVFVLVAVLAVAVGFGLLRRVRDGRLRVADDEQSLQAGDLGVPLGARATLVQFSTEFCAPCRSARRVLRALAERLDGVRHVELDAAEHLELVRTLDIRRTPTVLVLDSGGRIVSRAVGVPSAEQLTGALGVVPGAGA